MFDIVAAFDKWVIRQPDHPAVVDEHGTCSYAAFQKAAHQFASALAAERAERVAILLPQGVHAYATMFACMMNGAVYVPLNITAPQTKLCQILREFQPQAIISHREHLSQAIIAATPGVSVIDASAPPSATMVRSTEGQDLAYVMYTSGSTGRPKGVMIPRTALSHYCGWVSDTLNLRPHDRMSQHHNLGFDMSALDIYGALTNGATLYPLTGAKDRLMPATAISRHQLSIWHSVPSGINLIRRSQQLTAEYCKSIRRWMFCGEPLLPDQVADIFAATPDAEVLNMYGPTEATISCTQIFMTRGNYRNACDASVALGDAIPGMSVELLGGKDDTEGEIVISGPQLAIGYWDNDDATAAAFRTVATPDGPRRSYFTGDWAERQGPHLFFKTRMDFQVKVQGFRIELDEVAGAIRAAGWPVVSVVKHNDGLAAVMEEIDGQALDEAGLRATLGNSLEPYAIPRSFHLVAQMPTNDNGKIDAKAVFAWLVGKGV